MPAARPFSQTLLRALGLAAFWTLVGLAFASQFYLSSSLLGRPVGWGQAISYSLEDWYVYAVLSWPVLRLAHRFPPESHAPVRSAAIHLAAALGFSLLYVVLRAVVGQVHNLIIDEPGTFLDVFQPLLVKTSPFNLLVYGVILSVSHALDYYRRYHDRTVQTLELEKHLTEARLQSLLRQLEPHFLFNTLNGIASLMYSDVAAADRMLVRLSELLRQTMAQSGAPLTPLREELAVLEKYLDIERIRFRDRLAVEVDTDPATLDAQVPSLMLQPLVENAIRHGIEPNEGAGRITLRSARRGDQLVLTVADNGRGVPEGGFKREGIGLGNTRARLAELYGAQHSFELANQPGGGLCITVTLPFNSVAERRS